VLSVRGPTLSSGAKDRLDGLREGLKDARVTLGEVAGNWHTEEAERAVGSWLELVLPSGLRPGVVASQNDAMAIGARRALEHAASRGKRTDLGQVPIIGVDGIEAEGRKYVDEGLLAATIVLPSSTGPAIDLLVKSAKGESIPENVVTPISSYPTLPDLQKSAAPA
jgi:ribose transport system substrate-binding protein